MNAPLPPGSLDLLNRLRDLQEPSAPGWFPPAPGWWLLAILGLGAAAGISAWLLRRSARQRRQAFASLRAWADRHPETLDARALASLTDLLRRYARASGRAAASLGAAEFAEHLVANTGSEALRVLADAPYRPDARVSRQPLLAACEAYLRGRRC